MNSIISIVGLTRRRECQSSNARHGTKPFATHGGGPVHDRACTIQQEKFNLRQRQYSIFYFVFLTIYAVQS